MMSSRTGKIFCPVNPHSVSIITPVLNAGCYIEKCIKSVANQGLSCVEHIIVDGGSSDSTINTVKRLEVELQSIRLFVKTGCNQTSAMNYGLSQASGDLICFLNADDWLAPNALINSLKIFDSNPRIDFIVGTLVNISSNGSTWISPPSTRLCDLLLYSRFRWPLNPSCYIFRKSLQDKIGPYPESEELVMDYWFLLRARLLGQWVSVNHVLGVFYRHESNKSSLANNVELQLFQTRRAFLNSTAPILWKVYARLLDAFWFLSKPIYDQTVLRLIVARLSRVLLYVRRYKKRQSN